MLGGSRLLLGADTLVRASFEIIGAGAGRGGDYDNAGYTPYGSAGLDAERLLFDLLLLPATVIRLGVGAAGGSGIKNGGAAGIGGARGADWIDCRGGNGVTGADSWPVPSPSGGGAGGAASAILLLGETYGAGGAGGGAGARYNVNGTTATATGYNSVPAGGNGTMASDFGSGGAGGGIILGGVGGIATRGAQGQSRLPSAALPFTASALGNGYGRGAYLFGGTPVDATNGLIVITVNGVPYIFYHQGAGVSSTFIIPG